MDNETYTQQGMDDVQIQEWLESLDSVLESSGPEVTAEILERLRAHAKVAGIELPFTANTPYANTIPVRLEPLFPGDQQLERRIKSLIRWNALAMVVRANKVEHNIGGHISTYASAAIGRTWPGSLPLAGRKATATCASFASTIYLPLYGPRTAAATATPG